jgi:hypothetical protein
VLVGLKVVVAGWLFVTRADLSGVDYSLPTGVSWAPLVYAFF